MSVHNLVHPVIYQGTLFTRRLLDFKSKIPPPFFFSVACGQSGCVGTSAGGFWYYFVRFGTEHKRLSFIIIKTFTVIPHRGKHRGVQGLGWF